MSTPEEAVGAALAAKDWVELRRLLDSGAGTACPGLVPALLEARRYRELRHHLAAAFDVGAADLGQLLRHALLLLSEAERGAAAAADDDDLADLQAAAHKALTARACGPLNRSPPPRARLSVCAHTCATCDERRAFFADRTRSECSCPRRRLQAAEAQRAPGTAGPAAAAPATGTLCTARLAVAALRDFQPGATRLLHAVTACSCSDQAAAAALRGLNGEQATALLRYLTTWVGVHLTEAPSPPHSERDRRQPTAAGSFFPSCLQTMSWASLLLDVHSRTLLFRADGVEAAERLRGAVTQHALTTSRLSRLLARARARFRVLHALPPPSLPHRRGRLRGASRAAARARRAACRTCGRRSRCRRRRGWWPACTAWSTSRSRR